MGGDDFDDRLTDYLLAEFKASDHIDLSHDEAAVQRVREGAEKAKIELSSSTSTTVNLPFLTMVKDTPHHMEVTVTRAKFDELTHDLVDRTAECFERCGDYSQRSVEGIACRRIDTYSGCSGQGSEDAWHGTIQGYQSG